MFFIQLLDFILKTLFRLSPIIGILVVYSYFFYFGAKFFANFQFFDLFKKFIVSDQEFTSLLKSVDDLKEEIAKAFEWQDLCNTFLSFLMIICTIVIGALLFKSLAGSFHNLNATDQCLDLMRKSYEKSLNIENLGKANFEYMNIVTQNLGKHFMEQEVTSILKNVVTSVPKVQPSDIGTIAPIFPDFPAGSTIGNDLLERLDAMKKRK